MSAAASRCRTGLYLVHAGLPPQWDLALAQRCAAELAATLRGPDYQQFLAHMFGGEPRRWRDDLSGYDRLRFTVNAPDPNAVLHGGRCFVRAPKKGRPAVRDRTLPWFAVPGRRNADLNLVFGHWASLGYLPCAGYLRAGQRLRLGQPVDRHPVGRTRRSRLERAGPQPAAGAGMSASLTLIAALARNRVIGRDNRLPWHLPADLRFQAGHDGQASVDGPAHLGIHRPTAAGPPDDRAEPRSRLPRVRFTVARSLDEALEMAGATAEPMVIGGATLYRQTLPQAERLYLTVVEADISGDAWFPEWDARDWRLVWEEAHPADAKHVWPYRFQRWGADA